jgi:hypothetical protein
VCYSLWYNAPTMLPAGGRQHRRYIIPQNRCGRLGEEKNLDDDDILFTAVGFPPGGSGQ